MCGKRARRSRMSGTRSEKRKYRQKAVNLAILANEEQV